MTDDRIREGSTGAIELLVFFFQSRITSQRNLSCLSYDRVVQKAFDINEGSDIEKGRDFNHKQLQQGSDQQIHDEILWR